MPSILSPDTHVTDKLKTYKYGPVRSKGILLFTTVEILFNMALVYAALSMLPFAAVLNASPLEVRQANPKPATTTICNIPLWTEAPCRPGAGPWAKPTGMCND